MSEPTELPVPGRPCLDVKYTRLPPARTKDNKLTMACLSQRGDSYSSFTDKLHEAFGLYFANPYDEQTNTEVILI